MSVVTDPSTSSGWFSSAQAFIGLWTWFAAVVAYAAYRSQGAAEQDPILPPGPHGADE